jgi:hypothetical protein
VKSLLVIEDGDEYAEFARSFFSERFEILAARSEADARAVLATQPVAALLIDLRFDRATAALLVGDLDATATQLFAGDRERALRYLKDQQGALILGALRAAGHRQPAVFVHDFPPRRLANLRQLYGAVSAVSSFDASAILAAIEAA